MHGKIEDGQENKRHGFNVENPCGRKLQAHKGKNHYKMSYKQGCYNDTSQTQRTRKTPSWGRKQI